MASGDISLDPVNAIGLPPSPARLSARIECLPAMAGLHECGGGRRRTRHVIGPTGRHSTTQRHFQPLTSAIAAILAIPAAQAQPVPVALQEVTVTGSRIARTEQSVSIPVTSVDAEELRLTGEPNLEAALNQLPQFVAGTTAASNSLASATGTGAATLDLRGLGAARNLVLVNGRRYVFFDATLVTNINAIPSPLVQRVEVVTGGASAVYGSDAIAGVVNFILRDDFEGVEFRTQVNRDSRGDAWTNDYTVTLGGNFAEDRGNAVVSINYFDRGAIDTADRGFSSFVLANGTVDGRPALVPGGSSFVPNGRFSGIPSTPAAIAARPGLAEALAAAGLSGIGASGFIPDDSGLNVRPYNAATDFFDYSVDNFLRVPQERWGITALAHYDLSERVTAYAETAFTKNETEVRFASSFINDTLPIEVDNPFIGEPLRNVLAVLDATETGAAANDGLVRLGINRRFSEAGPRRNLDDRDAWRALVGLRGNLDSFDDAYLRDLTFDLYYSHARSDNTQLQIGNISRSAFARGILSGSGPGGAPLVNPFGPNISAEALDVIRVNSNNSDTTELDVVAGTINGTIMDLPAGPFAASVGFEWRSSSAVFTPDRLLATGDVAGFNPINATSGEIEVTELFAEVEVPLVAGLTGVESLSLKGAARWSDYDLEQVGSVWTYFGGLDWRISSELALGGQFQRAIRAPNVAEAFGGQRQFPIQATDPCAQAAAATDPTRRALCIGTGVPEALVGNPAVQPNQEVPGLFGGNPNLDAETSDTVTLSLIYTPAWARDLRVGIDYFDIEVDDAIAPLAGGIGSILSLCYLQLQDANSVACRAVSRNPASGIIQSPFVVTALNENIGSLETAGVDLRADYAFGADFGLFGGASDFQLSFLGTWLDEFTLTPLNDQPQRKNYCLGAFGSGTCGEPKPEFKTFTRLAWTSGPLTVSVSHRWIDSVDLDVIVLPARRGEPGPAPSSVPVASFGSEQYVDLAFNYDVGEKFAVWGGVNNVFDNDPPLLGANQRRANTFPDTYDPFGTEFFIGASIRL
mgnify:CR=1 FL=1